MQTLKCKYVISKITYRSYLPIRLSLYSKKKIREISEINYIFKLLLAFKNELNNRQDPRDIWEILNEINSMKTKCIIFSKCVIFIFSRLNVGAKIHVMSEGLNRVIPIEFSECSRPTTVVLQRQQKDQDRLEMSINYEY